MRTPTTDELMIRIQVLEGRLASYGKIWLEQWTMTQEIIAKRDRLMTMILRGMTTGVIAPGDAPEITKWLKERDECPFD